jgi:hypothetical protein
MNTIRSIRSIRRPIRTALAVLAVAAIPVAAAALPAAGHSTTKASTVTTVTTVTTTTTTAGSCPTGWGSLPESGHRSGKPADPNAMTNVRSGRHACYDRLVVDFRGGSISYSVRYVKAVSMDASGAPVPLRGRAKLQIIVQPPDYTPWGQTTYWPANQRELANVTGYRTLRQVAWAGSFEGRTTLGVGVRARLPFRTFTLAGPGPNSRLVIDIAHHW